MFAINNEVAWVRVDTQTILSIHHNIITQNPRISLSYNDHRSWYLHIKNVQEVDRGWYMCQVNTDPMRSRKGYLQVVVPPVIIDNMTSTDMVVREGTNVTMVCRATGYPEPYVMWRREDGQEFNCNGESAAATIPAAPAQLPPEWQRVPTRKKRKIREDSPPLQPTMETSNKYASLPLDPADDPSHSLERPNKPPPIVLYGIEDVNELTKLIESVILITEFKLKIVNKNLLRLMVNSTENYKRVPGTPLVFQSVVIFFILHLQACVSQYLSPVAHSVRRREDVRGRLFIDCKMASSRLVVNLDQPEADLIIMTWLTDEDMEQDDEHPQEVPRNNIPEELLSDPEDECIPSDHDSES
ncbi:hypothetical protein ACJJTC_005767 [Scirpophaga incertulas]